jgi:hypothetical protein
VRRWLVLPILGFALTLGAGCGPTCQEYCEHLYGICMEGQADVSETDYLVTCLSDCSYVDGRCENAADLRACAVSAETCVDTQTCLSCELFVAGE